MVRLPLAPEQIAAGRRLGGVLRSARGGRRLVEVALAAGISPETLRKIETGRLPTPAFGTVVQLSEVLGIPLAELADAWRADPAREESAFGADAVEAAS
ncbi:transcriptional regulator [Streptomyces sp. IMTB 2501]|uniref:helix-turn-helix domain-containing protein n=1 Tax=Streptomyces sp. IMTB 2501 TaxID=1776340 RepID=UPI00096D97C8|nr:helix-turn-helix transcriptional regulator [Streptomyces sp. IMTB 2501]OLZ72204.1 transcriptional regulator [Streptomyces sp. IMTB 2501]